MTLKKSLRTLPLLVLILFFQVCFGQSLKLKGRIVDSQDQQSIEYATISLFSSDSIYQDGTVSDESGVFNIETKKANASYILVEFLGYQPYYSRIFNPSDQIDLGIIPLSLQTTQLDEVLISGRASSDIHKLDKQVFSASQFQNAKGGVASDVLKNLPSISINSFGEISVRGNTGFLLMINGKPIQGNPAVVLQQLSANAIDDIEIITSPSAKYDPDGHSGIINIKTRVVTGEGLYLSANVLAGAPSIEPYSNQELPYRYGADITINSKKGKWDFSSGLDYRRYDISGRREGYVNTFINGILTEFPSDGERSSNEINYSGRASLTYSPNNKNTITSGVYAGKRTKERIADILYTNQQRSQIGLDQYKGGSYYFDQYTATGDVLQNPNPVSRITYFNKNLLVRKGDFVIGSLDYAHSFNDKSSLKASALYERTILGGPLDNANLQYPQTDIILEQQHNENNNPLDGVRVQLDYLSKIGKANWESGYQFRYLHHPGDFLYQDRDLKTNTWVVNPTFTNSIDLKREIHSVYSQLSNNAGKLQYSVGLRVEYFDRNVGIARPEQHFRLNRVNVFPSAQISYPINEGSTIKAGFSSRIERTTTFKMTPFPEREHNETLEQGDAELLPEYINGIELGFIRKWADHSFFATAYYRHVQNVINRVNTIYADTILNRIYTNAGIAQAAGLEFGSTFYPLKKWKVYLGANIYNYSIKGDLFGDVINTQNTVYSINANTSVDITKSVSAQLAMNYLSATVTAQGKDSDFYNPSLVVRKSLLDGKINVALQWQNIDMGLWRVNEQRITTERNNFFTTTNYVYEVDIVQMTISYQINQTRKNLRLPDSEFGKKEF